jgi:hypothetical protein
MHNFFHRKPSPASPAAKPRPTGSACLIGKSSSNAIHPFSPSQTFRKGYIACNYTVFTTIHIFFSEPNEPKSNSEPKPNWHRLPNLEPGLLEHVFKCFPASSRSPSGAKTSQMGVYNPYIPKYKISRPKSPPNVRNSERNHPPATSDIVYIYLLMSPTPTQQPRPITHPRPPIRHTRHIIHLPAHPKNHIGKPDLSRDHGRTLFFLGGG